MKVLIDSGTSRLHVGFWDNDCLIETKHLDYPENTQQLVALIYSLVSHVQVTAVVACSVSRLWQQPLFTILEGRFKDKLRIIRTVNDINLKVPYTKPETYGIDRALAVSAAYRRFHDSCVVVDAGTAVTIDAVTHYGDVAGGYIYPGLTLHTRALSAETGLPEINVSMQGDYIGTDTESSIRLGIGYGFLAAIEQLALLAKGAVTAENRILITGGNADKLSGIIEGTVVPGLVLEGLAIADNQV